jgi:hypothetical protein
MGWACHCGATADLVLYTLDCDPEEIERAPGEIVPTHLALCPRHDPARRAELPSMEAPC